MKNFLRQLLGLQTLKILLFNPNYTNPKELKGFTKYPTILLSSYRVDDYKIIDTGIPVKKK